MNLDFFKGLENNLKDIKDKGFVNNFISELTDYLNNFKDKKERGKEQEINVLRKDDSLYQVVDFSLKGVYLQNTENNAIFEETNISNELKNKISNDYILRYKNGKYIFEEELTDDFFNNMVDIKKLKEIQEKFVKKTNILKNDETTKYIVLSREKDFSLLKYEKGEIEVPNVLLPYFINHNSVLYYKNGKFHKDLTN